MADAGLVSREVGISWTRLREFIECGIHAKLKNEGKATKVRDIRVFFPGTVVDRVMRLWLNSDDPQPGQMAEVCAVIMDAEEAKAMETADGIVRWRHRDDKAEVLAKCVDCVNRLEPILQQYVLPYDYEPALRFRVPLTVPHLDGTPQRVWLIGEMDLFTGTRTEPRQHAVWDLKMTEDNGYWRKTTGQLLFYDLAVRAMTGSYPVQCGLLQPLCTRPVLGFTFTEQERRELVAHVLRYCAAVWRNDFPIRPTLDLCGYCDTRGACPRYAAPKSGRVPGLVSPV